jgi:hypothetical protein
MEAAEISATPASIVDLNMNRPKILKAHRKCCDYAEYCRRMSTGHSP